MRQQDDIFSRIIKSKTIILAILSGFFVLYAVIAFIIVFSNEKELYSMIGNIYGPLSLIGVGMVLAVDSFYKMASNHKIVKILGLLTLLLGIIDVLLLTLLFWQIIPIYETGAGSTSYYYTSLTPSIPYKLIMSLSSIVAFSFLGSIIMNIKNNHKLLPFLKYTAMGFLACASIISIISNFVSFSGDSLGSMRVVFVQIVSWVSAIALGIAAFYLSKTVTWKGEESEDDSLETKRKPSDKTDANIAPASTNPFSNVTPLPDIVAEDEKPATDAELSSTSSNLSEKAPATIGVTPGINNTLSGAVAENNPIAANTSMENSATSNAAGFSSFSTTTPDVNNPPVETNPAVTNPENTPIISHN